MSRLTRASAIGLASLALAPSAHGAPTDEASAVAAEASFVEGLNLMKAGRCKEAIPKFEESQRLESASGTVLNLAYCQAELGHPASAWLSYRRALGLAVAQGKPQHERLAREQAEKLAPEVPHLNLVFNGEAPRTLTIQLDTEPLPKAMWTVPIPIDPGVHAVIAVVAGKNVWQQALSIAPREQAKLVLPHFESVAGAEPVSVEPAGSASLARKAPTVPPRPVDHQPARSPSLPYAALSSAGLAVLALSAGIIAASIASAPPAGNNRAERQADLARRDDYATTANVCFTAAGVLSAVAVVTFVWR